MESQRTMWVFQRQVSLGGHDDEHLWECNYGWSQLSVFIQVKLCYLWEYRTAVTAHRVSNVEHEQSNM
jgi:hypothetical protein